MASLPQSLSPFDRLRLYSFESDLEFANGLAIILGHPGTPANEAEITREDDLVLQAKCFFFSRLPRLLLLDLGHWANFPSIGKRTLCHPLTWQPTNLG